MAEEQQNEISQEDTDKDDLYMEPKPKPKLVRVLTVLAYILSVSMAAILLSVYYVFMWDGQPTLARRTDSRMGHSISLGDYEYVDMYDQNSENITSAVYENKVLSKNAIGIKNLIIDNSIDSNLTNNTDNIDDVHGTNLKYNQNKTTGKSMGQPTKSYDLFISTSTVTPTEDDLIDINDEAEDSTNINSIDIRNNILYKKYFYKKLITP